MRSVKRIEIIIDALRVGLVTKALDDFGVSGYSVIASVLGKGGRGVRSGDDLSGPSGNSMIITTCPPEDVDRLVEIIRPTLKRFGGLCLLSDAQWVIN